MNLVDFEKVAGVRDDALEKEALIGAALGAVGKRMAASYAKDPMKAVGHGLNAYFVGTAPGTFNKSLRQAKKVPQTIGKTF